MDTNTQSSVEQLYHYLSNLETTNRELQAEVATLKAQNAALKRSVGSYKANATRRRKASMAVSA